MSQTPIRTQCNQDRRAVWLAPKPAHIDGGPYGTYSVVRPPCSMQDRLLLIWRDQVGVGAGNRFEELAESHRLPPLVPTIIAGRIDRLMNR
jgi:hypothetical protein